MQTKMAAPIQRAVCKDSESEIRIDYPVRLCSIFTITSQALVVAGQSGWLRLERDLQAGEILHAQLTTWYGNDENKHDKSHFNLQQILIQYTYGPISLWQTSYSKRKYLDVYITQVSQGKRA